VRDGCVGQCPSPPRRELGAGRVVQPYLGKWGCDGCLGCCQRWMAMQALGIF